MAIHAIIQARTGSTRLPGKVLMELGGKPVLQNVIERVKRSKLIDSIVIATTKDRADAPIINIADTSRVEYFRGSTEDVLDRYFQAAKKFRSDQIVRITSDCPLIDPGVIDLVIKQHLSENNDYTSNALIPSFPDGLDTEIFRFSVLEQSWREAKIPYQREHATQYITKNPQLFKLGNLLDKVDNSSKRWTLDELADYEFINIIYNELKHQGNTFTQNDVLKLLSRKPEIESINSHIGRNEGLLKSMRKDGIITEEDR